MTMKKWLARGRDLDKVGEDVRILKEELARAIAQIEHSRREQDRARELMEEARSDAERRIRDLEDELRRAEGDHVKEAERLGIALVKLQRIVDLQVEQLDRTATGLLERIETIKEGAPIRRNRHDAGSVGEDPDLH